MIPGWKNKISNSHQIGGIETSVLDNGAARGNRIAWITTGTGLSYKVVIDRGLDIADAFFNGQSLAWLSHLGVSQPQIFSDHGLDWLRTFGGGLLVTCGLSHVGGPESDEYGQRGLHGFISNIPAEITSVKQPDISREEFDISITGVIRETKIFGPSLEMTRTIKSKLGESAIYIHDEICNRGNTPAPHMILYHFNFGWPLVNEGTRLLWKGKLVPRLDANGKMINQSAFPKICPAPQEKHSGTGEEVAFIEIQAEADGTATAGLYNPELELAVKMTYDKAQLPWLTNWQHWGKGEYVTGIEPGTHPPIGQSAARKAGTLIEIKPDQKINYDIKLEVITQSNEIQLLLNNQ
jgi:hypothetical protein